MTGALKMGSWRWRPGRCNRKVLFTVVLVVTVVVLVLLMGAVEQAASYNAAGAEAEITWPRYSSVDDGHMPPTLKGPGTVVAQVGGSTSLLERLLNGRGVSKEIITLDMTRPASSDITCFHTKTDPSYAVCPHPSTQDRHISNQLKADGVWQPRTLGLLPVALGHYPSSTLVDVGAHIGVFSLLGARLGAAVVAVEPVWSSAIRLHAGAARGKVSTSVKILLHAITREPMQVTLKYKNGNLGGTSVVEVTPQEADSIRSGQHGLATSITLDSLAPFINTSVIILKVDIEGRECEGITGGRELLTTHFTPYIFMEWSVMANNKHKYHSPCSPHHLREMVQWLVSRGYHAHISKSGAALIPAKMELWRAGDIYWRHSKAPPLHPSTH